MSKTTVLIFLNGLFLNVKRLGAEYSKFSIFFRILFGGSEKCYTLDFLCSCRMMKESFFFLHIFG